jgi:kynureninase
VVATDDFPSSRYLWAAQAARGFDVVAVEPGAVADAIDERTAAVAVSLVSPLTGRLLDAAPVVARARDAGAVVVLDAYQAVGVVPVDVIALGADVVVGGTCKWLGGGSMGLAFLYVREHRVAEWSPAYPGWVGHADVAAFASTFAPHRTAWRFQQGSPAVEPLYTCRRGLEAVREVGVDALRARSVALTTRIHARALAAGLRGPTPADPARRGGAVVLEVPDGPRVVAALDRQGYDVEWRPGYGVRVGPHPGCTEAECDDVVDAIARVLG